MAASAKVLIAVKMYTVRQLRRAGKKIYRLESHISKIFWGKAPDSDNGELQREFNHTRAAYDKI